MNVFVLMCLWTGASIIAHCSIYTILFNSLPGEENLKVNLLYIQQIFGTLMARSMLLNNIAAQIADAVLVRDMLEFTLSCLLRGFFRFIAVTWSGLIIFGSPFFHWSYG